MIFCIGFVKEKSDLVNKTNETKSNPNMQDISNRFRENYNGKNKFVLLGLHIRLASFFIFPLFQISLNEGLLISPVCSNAQRKDCLSGRKSCSTKRAAIRYGECQCNQEESPCKRNRPHLLTFTGLSRFTL